MAVPPDPAKLAIGAIFKNEGPYILEWIAYHRSIGIERIVIADNDSDDGSAELLRELDRRQIVSSFPYQGSPGVAPQLPAYAELLERYGHLSEWFAFFDAEQFLVPTGSQPLGPVLEGLTDDPSIGGIALNWAIYGSSARKTQGGGLVLERFQKRARNDAPMNLHYKSIVRTAAVLGPAANPHHFNLRPGYRYVQADGSDLASNPSRGLGLSTKTVWAPLRINHYVVKSREEFFQRKQPRGRATRTQEYRPDEFFEHHDRNDEFEPIPVATVEQVESGLVKLARELGQPAARWLPALGRTADPAGARACDGVFEQMIVAPSEIRLRGWAIGRDGGPAEIVAVKVGDREVRDFRVRSYKRGDVVRRFAHANIECGFEVTFARGHLGEPSRGVSVLVARGPFARPEPIRNAAVVSDGE